MTDGYDPCLNYGDAQRDVIQRLRMQWDDSDRNLMNGDAVSCNEDGVSAVGRSVAALHEDGADDCWYVAEANHMGEVIDGYPVAAERSNVPFRCQYRIQNFLFGD